jgi:hypothetical protein
MSNSKKEREKERIVRDFLLLLHRESQKPDSTIIPPTAWDTLAGLQASLASANDDNIKTIARAITKWCKDHHHSAILQALRPVQGDAIDEGEDPVDDETERQILRLTNFSIRFVDETISQAKGQHEQQS